MITTYLNSSTSNTSFSSYTHKNNPVSTSTQDLQKGEQLIIRQGRTGTFETYLKNGMVRRIHPVQTAVSKAL